MNPPSEIASYATVPRTPVVYRGALSTTPFVGISSMFGNPFLERHRLPSPPWNQQHSDGTITKGDDTVAEQSRDYKEKTRVLKFDDCVRGTLGGFDKSVVLRTSHLASDIINGALSERGVPILLR